MKLFPHQVRALEETKDKNRVAYYLDMGLGKTFVGSEKAASFSQKILVVCQKSKIRDWIEHFKTYYDFPVLDLTNKKELSSFIESKEKCVGVINYDLVYRRTELKTLNNFTLMLDESSIIQNEKAKRSKFILRLNPENVILLSGTPTAGAYEKLWSQLHLLGWSISKNLFYSQYVNIEWLEVNMQGLKIPRVIGYKNVDRLKAKLRQYGAVFMKSEEVFELPRQNIILVADEPPKEYDEFMRNDMVTIDGKEFIADTTLTKRLYARMILSQFNPERLVAFKDLIESGDDRFLVFYNFNDELKILVEIAKSVEKPYSIVNGQKKDLTAYEDYSNSVTFLQYQAGAMGLNLQKANKIIYFSLTERSELFEQSKKRIHRIGQERPCFYYIMFSPTTVEGNIYGALKRKKDYTDELFREDFKCHKKTE